MKCITAAVFAALNSHPNNTLAIVTRGGALTLFLARYNRFQPFSFWQKLKLPDYFVITLPAMKLMRSFSLG